MLTAEATCVTFQLHKRDLQCGGCMMLGGGLYINHGIYLHFFSVFFQSGWLSWWSGWLFVLISFFPIFDFWCVVSHIFSLSFTLLFLSCVSVDVGVFITLACVVCVVRSINIYVMFG